MRYFIYKNGDRVVGYNMSNGLLPPPAIEISEAEAKEMGIYSPPPPPAPEPAPEPTTEDRLAAMEQAILTMMMEG